MIDLGTRNLERQWYMGAAAAADEQNFRWPPGPGSDRKPH